MYEDEVKVDLNLLEIAANANEGITSQERLQRLSEGIQAIAVKMFVTTSDHRAHLAAKMHEACDALRDVITADKSLSSTEVAELCAKHEGHYAEIENWASKAEQFANHRIKAGEVVKRHLHKI